MIPAIKRFRGLVALAVFLAACTSGDLVTAPDAPLFSITSGSGQVITLCKANNESPGGLATFAISSTGGGTLPQGDVVTLTAGTQPQDPATECLEVWQSDGSLGNFYVTITEMPQPGTEVDHILVFANRGDQLLYGVNTVTLDVDADNGAFVQFKNKGQEEPVPGRMTGGGHQVRVDDVRVTRGLTLHCDITLSNNLEFNWPGGNNWHLDKENLESVMCIDDPNYDPTPPDAPFDTFIARALGSLNQVEGSIVDFKFIDDGEPGRTDEAHFMIYAPNMGPGQVAPGDEVLVLQVSGQLDGGNLQAHEDQPHR